MSAIADSDLDHWEACEETRGLNFGRQILQPFYKIEKVPTRSSSQLLFYKPVFSGAAFESLRPVLRLTISLVKWKYIIFFFNNPELKFTASAMWPKQVLLINMKERLLKSLHGCELQRVKIRKEGLSIYLYVVKSQNEKFVMQDMWIRLQQLVKEKGNFF